MNELVFMKNWIDRTIDMLICKGNSIMAAFLHPLTFGEISHEKRTVKDIHGEAMGYAFIALHDLSISDDERKKLSKDALRLELEACERFDPIQENEPTRGILYLSAASLAYRIGDYDLARQLAQETMNGFPYSHVIDGINDLLQLIDETGVNDSAE